MTTSAHALPASRWQSGIWNWFATVDHKKIGLMYIATSFFYFILGGLLALTIRLELFEPGMQFLTPDGYNAVFSMHGTTMVFLFVIPIWAGFGNFFAPLMVGAPDMAFPRLNALSFWLFLFGSIFLYSSILIGEPPAAGWTSYPPLSGGTYSPTLGMDFWLMGLTVIGTSSLLGAINFIVTIWNMRAPGMGWYQLPLFVWTIFVMSQMILFSTPMLTGGFVLLLFDRHLDTTFFTQAGDPVLWQHIFWFYSHPAVYIMILPAFGIVSEILPVFSGKPIFGYKFIAFSSVAIGVLGFMVWLHHMFTVGANPTVQTAFMLLTMAIGVPTGVKMFNWIATMWNGSIRLTAPMKFAIGFLAMFLIGGISGVMQGSVPVDWQLHDTYFIVAHLHYVLFGGAMFGIFAGFYYWFPKMYGRMLDEGLGTLNFWLIMIGFNLTFFPMHYLGVLGMPRRIADYSGTMGWTQWNQVQTIGAFIIGLGVLVFMWNAFRAFQRPADAPDDPWDGYTLEWLTSSPPPAHNYDRVPVVTSLRPAWDRRHGKTHLDPGETPPEPF